MVRSYVFDYLLFPLAALITYLVSKIQLFAPRSIYVVVHDVRPADADLVFSTRYIETYYPHNLTVTLLIGLSILLILYLAYLIYAVRQPPVPIKLPWKTEIESHECSKDKRALDRSMSTWQGFMGVIQSQLPEVNAYRPSRMRSGTVASDTPLPEDIELKDLKLPPSAQFRDTTALRSKGDTSDRQREAEGDDADWKTVYCGEKADSLDGDGLIGVESWSPT